MSGGNKAQTVGYWYRPTFEVVPCAGPVDALKAVEVGGVTAWAGDQTASGTVTIDKPALWGGEASEGGVQGDLLVRMGDGAQAELEDGQRHRGVLSLRWDGGRFGAMNPYPKPIATMVQHITAGRSWYPETAVVPLTPLRALLHEARYFDANLAALTPEASADSLTISGLATTDQIIVRVLAGAWSPYLGYGTDTGYYSGPTTDPLWTCEFRSKNAAGTVTTHLPTLYMTEAAALSAAQAAGEIILTGSTSYTLWIYDGFLFNRGGLSLTIERTVPIGAMNPAHLIRHTLVSPSMQGEPDTLVDDASFEDAADIFFAEGLGVCTVWDPDQETVEALRARICDAAGAACSRRPSDGKWTLRAIRGASGTLPVLTDDDLIDLQVEPGVLDDAVNQLSVRWTDVVTHEERTTAPIHALGAIDDAGVNAQTLDYLALPTDALALRKAEAELRARATPIARLALTCTRKPWAWLRGDYFELQAPRHGIDSMVCMVGDIDRGTLRSGAIKITALQDVYSLPATSYAQTQDAVASTSATPVPVTEAALIEAPYAELVQALSPGDLSVLAADAGYVMSIAVRPAAGLHNYRLLTRPSGGTYEDRGTVDWCPAATVVGSSGYRDTSFTLSAGSLLDRVTIGTAALWGGTEIVRVDSLNVGTGAITLGRGCWDTVPRAHSAGERILFFDRWSGSDTVEYVDGDVVQVKQLPRSGVAVLAETAAPQLSLTLDSRANRPYPPADFQVNGETDPVAEAVPLVCTWAHRDRVIQQDMLVDTTEASIGPEAGTTYTLEASDADTAEVLHTETGITGTTFSITSTMVDFDRDVRLRLWAVRAGLASAQQHDLTVAVTGLGVDIDSYTTGLWAAYSVRKLLTAYSGNALQVRNVSGGALADIGFDGNGDVDAAALATHLGSNNGTARTWYNQQGTSGRDLDQSTTTEQPACATAGVFDGKIAFDGTDDWMPTGASSGTPAAFTVFVRGRLRSTAGTPIILEHSSNYNSNDSAIAYYASGAMSVGVHGSGGGGGYARSDFTSDYPNDNVQCWRFDRSQVTGGDMAKLFIGGAAETRDASGDSGTLPSGNFGAHPWFLGARSGATAPAALDVHTLLIYEAALSDADIAAISSILAAL